MKSRHIAALSLIGWYLMAPPVYMNPNGGGGFRINDKAHLSQWAVIDSFDTAAACSKYIAEMKKRVADDPMVERRVKARMQLDVCVSTDDSRLKEK
jgi:hypothetical protein